MADEERLAGAAGTPARSTRSQAPRADTGFAPALGLPPLAAPEDYLARRARSWTRPRWPVGCCGQRDRPHFLVDIGYPMDGPVTPAGRVISVGGRGDDPEAQVDFGEDYGVKHLLLCATIENSDLNRRWPRTGADGATYRASLQIRLRGLPLT